MTSVISLRKNIFPCHFDVKFTCQLQRRRWERNGHRESSESVRVISRPTITIRLTSELVLLSTKTQTLWILSMRQLARDCPLARSFGRSFAVCNFYTICIVQELLTETKYHKFRLLLALAQKPREQRFLISPRAHSRRELPIVLSSLR